MAHETGILPGDPAYMSRDPGPLVWLAAYDVVNLSCFEDLLNTVVWVDHPPRESLLLNKGLDLMSRWFHRTLSTRGKAGDATPVIVAVCIVLKNEDVRELICCMRRYEIVFSIEQDG